MSWLGGTSDDVPHLSEKTKQELLDSTPAYLRDARSKGLPVLGSGRVFPVDEESIKEDAIQIPAHWPRICGLDIGWDHPTAGVWIAWDRDTDTIHIYDVHRQSEATVATHASAIKRRGIWIPVAWPHDGLQHDKKAGVQIAQQYRDEGVAMLPEMATWPETGDGDTEVSRTSVEAGIMDMLTRMQQGRLKVARHLEPWFEEFRLFHRVDGKLVKLRDDLMSATRYGIMMLRFAIIEPVRPAFRKDRFERRGNWKAM